MRKPELLATAGSLDELERVIRAGADAVTIGEHRWGMRLPGSFSMDDIRAAVDLAHAAGAKIYVSVNQLIDHERLPELNEYLRRLAEIPVDAIEFGDPAVWMALREERLELPLHWAAEMTATNYATALFWRDKGAKRVVAARELNLEELHAFKRGIGSMELQVQVHGATNMYHSRRRLVQSYAGHIGKTLSDTGPEAGLYVIEREQRPHLKMPLFEDENGTHIMSPDDICLLEALDELLAEPIDSLKVEGLLKTPEYNETAVKSYRQAIDAYCADPAAYRFRPEWLDAIRELQDPDRELTFGFLFKEQVY